MKKTSIFLGIISLALILGACAPFTIDGGTSMADPVDPQTIPVAAEGKTCTEPVAVPLVKGKISYNGISFALDPALANEVIGQSCPAIPLSNDQAPGEAHPAYTAFTFPDFERENTDYQPEVRVYEVTGDMTEYTYPLNVLPEFRTFLEERPDPVIWFRAPLNTRQAYFKFNNGLGVRGIVQYMQDVFFYTNNGLLYEYNGLTHDGRYFVSFRHPLSVPFLKELDGFTLPPNNLNAQAIPISGWPSEYEQQRKVIEA